MPRCHAIILASGSGSRLRDELPKQFIKVAGKSLLEHTIDVFESHPGIADIHVVIPIAYRSLAEEILLKNRFRKVRRLLNGGSTRQESSSIGLAAIDDDDELVLLHDAVRPFVTHRIIDDCLAGLEEFEAVDVAIPSADTVIQVNSYGVITSIPDRNHMRLGQTPQGFRTGLIKKAHARFTADPDSEFAPTDDCGLVLHYGLAPIKVIDGEQQNMKVTYPEDLSQADRMFQLRSMEIPESVSLDGLRDKVMVVIGGARGIGREMVEIGAERGALAHSFSRASGVDVADFASVERALAQVLAERGRIDFVVNSAAVLGMGKLEDRSIDEIHHEIAINYMGCVHVAKAALPHLRESHGALLLFTSSSYSRGRALYSTYSSAKAAVVNLTQALSEEVAALGVRINVINPERAATPMRFEAFGAEPPETLLPADKAARASLRTLLSDFTGQVIDVRR